MRKIPVHLKLNVCLIIILSLYTCVCSQFRISVSDSVLKAVCGTNKVKVTFIYGNRLWFIDFSQPVPAFKKISTDSLPSVPVISNDGRKIAFATGIQNEPPFMGSVTSWICDLHEDSLPQKIAFPGFNPRFEQNASELAVIYATAGKRLTGKKYAFEGSGAVVRKKIRTGVTDTLWSQGSWFGGLSFDNKWLCTAESEVNAFMLDISSPSNKPCTLHTLPVLKNGSLKDTLIHLTTCNPSISSSRVVPNAMMYLDFSSDEITNAECFQPVLGTWGTHEKIFISRSNGTLVKFFDVPKEPASTAFINEHGEGYIYAKKWENPEWSNHPDFAAATLEVGRAWRVNGTPRETEDKESIYLINLKESVYLKLIELDTISAEKKPDLSFPWIWVDLPTGFSQSEDALWLKGSILSAEKNANNHKKFNEFVSIAGNRIRSEIPMISVEIFSSNGRMLSKTNIDRKKNYKIDSYPTLKGFCLIRIKLLNGKECTFPFSGIR